MFPLNSLTYILIAFGMLGLIILVFNRVRRDYCELGRLSPAVSRIQFGFFCVYALSSYVFLDSRLYHVSASGWLLALAILLMIVGFVVVLFTMPRLGMRSFGHKVGKLYTGGLYSYSRNPQLVGGFLLMLGYALLWLSWQGLVWVSLWIPTSYLMVRGEEEHLKRLFGDEYTGYCRKTPRYLGRVR